LSQRRIVPGNGAPQLAVTRNHHPPGVSKDSLDIGPANVPTNGGGGGGGGGAFRCGLGVVLGVRFVVVVVVVAVAAADNVGAPHRSGGEPKIEVAGTLPVGRHWRRLEGEEFGISVSIGEIVEIVLVQY